MLTASVVLERKQHNLPNREAVATVDKDTKYDATYQFGNTTVHIVAPKEITPARKEEILDDMYRAAWLIIDECIRNGRDV